MTGYSQMTPRQARATLAAIVLAVAAGVAVTWSPLANPRWNTQAGPSGDAALYRAEVERVHSGQSYYEAAAAELTARGYPTRSVFNWRTPLPVWLLGQLPSLVWGKTILGFLSFLLLWLAFEALSRDEAITTQTASVGMRRAFGPPTACTLLLIGPLLPTMSSDLCVMPELWAGVWIGLSICAYGVRRPGLGVAFGLTALWFRELSLPYVLLSAAIAWRQRRRGELAAWLLGLATWAAWYGLHIWRVLDLIAPDALAHSHGWIRFGAAGFVISTAQMNAYLVLLPQWVTAVYLAASLMGLVEWDTPLGRRIGLTVCLFLAAFTVAGQSFNQYWGWLIAPLLCFGVARCPESLVDLVRAAVKR
ncbi:MAG: hypothetical protein LLF97_10790 [Planctomycetaceae bacterium]|nr:hypothetical protein [Planctomycetaceae bacterium]